MQNIYTLDLNIFDLDNQNCKTHLKIFISSINIENDKKISIKLIKNNINYIKNIANIDNIILFSKKISKFKDNIEKIIISTNDKNDYMLKNIIQIITKILNYDIEKINVLKL